MKIYTLQALLPDEESVTRTLKVSGEKEALRLMKLKFSDAVSVKVLSERDIETEDLVSMESAKVEAEMRELDQLEAKHYQQKNRGLVMMIAGIVATIVLFLYGWIAWISFAIIAYGLYDFSSGAWGIKRARRLKEWELDLLKLKE